MQSRFGRYALLFVLLSSIVGSLSLMPLLAQSNETILTVGIYQWQQGNFADNIFAAFEEAHPNVKVVLVPIDDEVAYFGTPTTAEDVPTFMENIQKFAASADLLPVNMPGTSNMYSRAGAFLDITPLLSADANANIDDFYPAMLQSMQWDGGTWGLPIGGNVQIIVYNKEKFDEAGYPYPDETWSLLDYMNAGRELTIYNDEGEVEIPGFYGFDSALILRAGYGRSVFDPSTFPAQINLTDPELVSLVESWSEFETETSPNFEEGGRFNYDEVPMTLGGVYYLDSTFGMGGDWGGALLPNGGAGLYVQGYSISAGTVQPQLAYELLQYMTTSPEITYGFFGDVTARQSMNGVVPSETPFERTPYDAESQAMVDLAIANAIPAPEVDAFRYVQMAIWTVNDPEAEVEMDLPQALAQSQEDTNAILEAIDAEAQAAVITVATPIPTPVLQSGEIALVFGTESYYGPSSNQDLWRAAISEFVEQDPQVGHIELDTEYLDVTDRVEEQDCFYLGYNPIQDMDLSLIRNIDPYLAADVNYDPNNMVAGTLEQVTRDGMLWGFPMSIAPVVIWYDPNLFEQAGLPMPENDWTISEWEDAVRALYDGENPVFQTQSFGGSYILMLAAAYGGVPIDYSSLPYTIVADPIAIQAVQEVLDLAKDGLLDYQELVGDSGFMGGGGGGGGSIPMFDSILIPNDWRLQNREGEFAEPYRVVMFPRGTDYIPVSYSLSAAFISAQSPAPDACYRWLSFLAQRPELLNGMPTRKDSFEAALAYITDGEDVVQLYQDMAAALESSDAIVLASPYGGGGENIAMSLTNYLVTTWLNLAFDNYVLEDGDLEADLLESQGYIGEYQECISAFPILSNAEMQEMESEAWEDYYFQFIRCAVDVDPALTDFFAYALEGEEE